MKVREVISLIYPGPKQTIGELVVDAVIKESHHFRAYISEHPVENGSTMADHVDNLPISLELECLVSNTPMSLVGLTLYDSLQRSSSNNDFAQLAFDKIAEIFTKREPLSIVTTLKTYANMVLESLSIERDGHSAESLHFNCTAKQIRVINQKLINIPTPKVTRAQPKQAKGLQETKPMRTPLNPPPTRSPYWGH